MTTNTDRVPAEVFHPSEFLREELLARGIDRFDYYEALEHFGIHTGWSELAYFGGCSFSEPIAEALESYLGISARLWLSLQAQWDKRQGGASDDGIGV